MAQTQAIFLDKDGTLFADIPDGTNSAFMRFAPGAATGLRRLACLGLPLIVLSHEPGMAMGLVTQNDLNRMHRRMARMFQSVGAELSGFYYCAHHPGGRIAHLSRVCRCRRPLPGLLEFAAVEHHVDLARSWFIGDRLDGIEAGYRAGCETILVNDGNETEWQTGEMRTPHYVVDDFDQASLLVFRSDALQAVPLTPANEHPVVSDWHHTVVRQVSCG